jgi:uncharacterized membrane protein
MGVDPLAERYVEHFASALRKVPAPEREELVMEIRTHISDAIDAGAPTADVLDRLGPPDRLAKAYRAEIELQREGSNWLVRLLAATGLVITTSIPTMIIIPFLAVLGIGFVAAGALAVGMALFPFAEPSFSIASSVPAAVERLLGALIGIGLAIGGALALWALYWYVRLLVAAFRRVMV